MDDDSDDEGTPILKKPKKSTTAGGALRINTSEGLSGIKLKRQELKQQKKERKLKKLLKQRTRPADEASTADIPKKKSPPKISKSQQHEDGSETNTNTSAAGRSYSVSIAIPGSIIDNAQSPPLKAYLAGQVARAVAIFNVDEVIIYDDTGGGAIPTCEFMARIMQFLECPQYLRKSLFSLHPDLQYSGLIAPLDIPHHLRRDEVLPYREGVVSLKPTKEGKNISYIYVGLDRDCRVEKKLPEGARVTVKFDDCSPQYVLKPKGKLRGTVVSPHLPRTEAGLYWGYSVRIASSLSKVFTEVPFKDATKYDVTIGTSEKGTSVQELKLVQGKGNDGKKIKHVLIVFGGVEGLEYALENDESLMEDDVSVLFDYYVNTCPNQGSRTIRSEEAILISMAAIAPIIQNSVRN